ncbi:MAG: hypothetical protein SVR94_15270, partial [Pseudomonadota bacterium]|nr:hypothetical protein [Pseudomonadota bacterium]
REEEFKSDDDFREFIEPEQWVQVRKWFTFSSRRGNTRINDFSQSSNIYTIAVQTREMPEPADKSTAESSEQTSTADNQLDETTVAKRNAAFKAQQHAYMVTVQYRGFNRPPKTLMVNPYGILPDSQHEQMSLDEEDENNQFKTTL